MIQLWLKALMREWWARFQVPPNPTQVPYAETRRALRRYERAQYRLHHGQGSHK